MEILVNSIIFYSNYTYLALQKKTPTGQTGQRMGSNNIFYSKGFSVLKFSMNTNACVIGVLISGISFIYCICKTIDILILLKENQCRHVLYLIYVAYYQQKRNHYLQNIARLLL